ncbi:hypothetical protein ACMFMG_010912 [Clarireedia jacksonii]
MTKPSFRCQQQQLQEKTTTQSTTQFNPSHIAHLTPPAKQSNQIKSNQINQSIHPQLGSPRLFLQIARPRPIYKDNQYSLEIILSRPSYCSLSELRGLRAVFTKWNKEN